MARHSVVKKEAEREALLENLIGRHVIKKRVTNGYFRNKPISKD